MPVAVGEGRLGRAIGKQAGRLATAGLLDEAAPQGSRNLATVAGAPRPSGGSSSCSPMPGSALQPVQGYTNGIVLWREEILAYFRWVGLRRYAEG